jgi:hypothetical protein
MGMMTQEHIQYVADNMLLFTTSRRYSPEELTQIYAIYNAITGERKKATSCGRCLEGVKKRIILEYNKTL